MLTVQAGNARDAQKVMATAFMVLSGPLIECPRGAPSVPRASFEHGCLPPSGISSSVRSYDPKHLASRSHSEYVAGTSLEDILAKEEEHADELSDWLERLTARV